MSSNDRWGPLESASLWRKIAVGMWSRPSEPTIFGTQTVLCEEMIDYLDQVYETTGEKITPTGFLVGVVAKFFEENPDLNVIMIGNEVRQRRDIDIFCQVSIPGDNGNQPDLSGVKLSRCDRFDLLEIADRLSRSVSSVRSGDDENLGSSRSALDLVPSRLKPAIMRLVETLTFEVPFDLDRLGIRSDPFGSAMVTSVGQFEVEQAFAPLVPASRCPLVVLPGAIRDGVVAVDGEPAVRKIMTVSVTADHRCYDGYQGGQFMRAINRMVADPWSYFPPPSHWASANEPQREPKETAPMSE
ncbi:MAG: 2-oxo acid dehydrogenase subunit E2 [Persicimonas sp.]